MTFRIKKHSPNSACISSSSLAAPASGHGYIFWHAQMRLHLFKICGHYLSYRYGRTVHTQIYTIPTHKITKQSFL